MPSSDGGGDKDERDVEFEAVMRMKNEPLVLNEEEAARFDELRKRRSPRFCNPLPIDGGDSDA